MTILYVTSWNLAGPLVTCPPPCPSPQYGNLRNVVAELGLQEAPDKLCPPSSRMEFIIGKWAAFVYQDFTAYRKYKQI